MLENAIFYADSISYYNKNEFVKTMPILSFPFDSWLTYTNYISG